MRKEKKRRKKKREGDIRTLKKHWLIQSCAVYLPAFFFNSKPVGKLPVIVASLIVVVVVIVVVFIVAFVDPE